MWLNLFIILVSFVITVANVQSIRESRETARMLEKRRQDATKEVDPQLALAKRLGYGTNLGYGLPYPTTAPPAPSVIRSADIQGAAYRSAIVKLKAELLEATAERDKVRSELATLKRARPLPPETVQRALGDQRRCRALLERWDRIDDGGVVAGSATDAVKGCRDLLAEALKAEAVTVESFCQTHNHTVRTYR